MVLLRGGADQLDLVAHRYNVASEEEFAADISSYESMQLTQGQLSYFFIEQPVNAIRASNSAHAATINAPYEARSAELIVSDDGIDPLLLITFSLPKLALNKITDSMRQAPDEDF